MLLDIATPFMRRLSAHVSPKMPTSTASRTNGLLRALMHAWRNPPEVVSNISAGIGKGKSGLVLMALSVK